MATTATAGVKRSEYKDAIKARQDAERLAAAEGEVENYRTQRDSSIALLQALRKVHLDHAKAHGIGNVEQAISEVEYTLTNAKSYLSRAESRLAQLKGAAPVNDDDNE